jgi:UDP-N-acetylglucosamine 4,6-dehydratase
MFDMAKAIAPEARIEEIGIRPGEKLHEVMIPADDARHTLEYKDHYRIFPEFQNWDINFKPNDNGKKLPDGFSYSSDNNNKWLTKDELLKLIGDL